MNFLVDMESSVFANVGKVSDSLVESWLRSGVEPQG